MTLHHSVLSLGMTLILANPVIVLTGATRSPDGSASDYRATSARGTGSGVEVADQRRWRESGENSGAAAPGNSAPAGTGSGTSAPTDAGSFHAPQSYFYIGPQTVVKSMMSPDGMPCMNQAEINLSIARGSRGCQRVVPTASPAPAAQAQAAAPAVVAAAQPIVITSRDVSTLLVKGSGITRQPPGTEVLVNLDAIVYTSDDPRTLTTEVNGTPVVVEATPTSYTWTWGDGASTSTTDPGAPYPDQTVSHRYASTAQGVTITLTTTWTATFTPDGQETQDVTGTITTTDSTAPFDVVRPISYLTDDAEEAQGH